MRGSPKISLRMPTSKAGTGADTTTATSRIIRPVWQELPQHWLSCRAFADLDGGRLSGEQPTTAVADGRGPVRDLRRLGFYLRRAQGRRRGPAAPGAQRRALPRRRPRAVRMVRLAPPPSSWSRLARTDGGRVARGCGARCIAAGRGHRWRHLGRAAPTVRDDRVAARDDPGLAGAHQTA